MKITIELTDAEVMGIKSYLKEVDGIKRPKKSDIKNVVESFVYGMHTSHEALSDHIRTSEENLKHNA